MATGNTDDLKPVASPLDLSLKVVNIAKTIKEEECNDTKCLEEHKSVSSEELLSLKLLHDRLSKTMELLLPQEKLKKFEEMKSTQIPSSTTDNNVPDFDYKTTMRALLSLVESENITANEDEEKNMSSFFPTKMSAPPYMDSWSYWHDYILSLYLMNSSLTSSLPPPPPIPPPPIPPSLSSSLFPPPFNFLPTSPNSMLFQNMLTNLINRSSMKSQEENVAKPFIPENVSQDFGYKNKKLNSYQFLKDSNLLYNSFNASRNLGLTKNKLLDSPESFGVSLRGNQKYSIYYQQRPNNIFNNNFLSPTCSSTISSKSNHNSLYKNNTNNNNNNTFFNDDHNRKNHISADCGFKKSMLTSNNNNNKPHKTINRNESISTNSKMSSEKLSKFSNYEHGTYNNNNTSGNNAIPSNFDNIPIPIPLVNRYKETVFNCSCGQEFENLYSFTIHMKSTHHSPNSSKIERSIPKLVRGQDMWINSETEQTKEILRCMRCHQSFRTLPELTMHMVETNHYSEIVYSDTGKCVFLNSDHDKIKQSYTTINSPVSSPGDVIRKLKRTFSSSTSSDIGTEEENIKKRKISSPDESFTSSVKPLKEALTEIVNVQNSNTDNLNENEEMNIGDGILQIKEADSGTGDNQPDSDSSSVSKVPKCLDSKEPLINSTNTCDSVIRQIENFVEKSLPKPPHNEYNIVSSVFSNSNLNHKTNKSSTKCISSKSNNIERSWKADSKAPHNERSDSVSKQKEISSDIMNNFNFKNYSISSSESLENPLSSLQTLVETIQKNTAQIKEQSSMNYKINQLQNKDSTSYSYSSKSPVVCDSLIQLQALVAGTSVNNANNNSNNGSSKQNEPKQSGYSMSERSKLFKGNGNQDSSSTFLTWCHKLGELLGLPQALSQAMLTQDAIKDLANSVLMMNNGSQSSLEANNSTDEENNNCINMTSELTNSDSEMKSFQGRDCDPIEQLKNLLNSTSEPTQSNHSQMVANKYINGPSTHASSPPAISKKAKCHFCNKPFANKGQVRLHISKGKCPSLMRSCHSSCNQIEPLVNNTISPVNYESNFTSIYKLKDINDKDNSTKGELDSSLSGSTRDNSMISNKSVNLIREYFKFAKQMIGSDDLLGSPSSKVESKIE